MKLNDEEKDEARGLFKDWEEAKHEEEEAASKVSFLEEQLEGLGIDPDNPPDWINE